MQADYTRLHIATFRVCVRPENQWIISLIQKKKLDNRPTHSNINYSALDAQRSIASCNDIIGSDYFDTHSLRNIGSVYTKLIEDGQANKLIYNETTKMYLEAFAEKKRLQIQNINKRKNNKNKKNNKKRKSKPYFPTRKKGAWAILYALTEHHIHTISNDNNITYPPVSKVDIIEGAKRHIFDENAFRLKRGSGGKTAWNSHERLLRYGLIEEICNNYKLTEKGYKMGIKMIMFEYKLATKRNNRKRLRIRNVNNNDGQPQYKRRRVSYMHNRGNVSLSDINSIDTTIAIKINGHKYKLCIIVDRNESSSNKNEAIDFWDRLNKRKDICVTERNLCIGDYAFGLWKDNNNLSINPCDVSDDSYLVLPFNFERKTYSDLMLSFEDKRLSQQMYRISLLDDYWVKKSIILEGSIHRDVVEDNIFEVKKAIQYIQTIYGESIIQTQHRNDTLNKLIYLTKSIYHWLHNIDITGYKFISNKDLKILTNKTDAVIKAKDNILFARQLCNDFQCTDKEAYYITREYPTFKSLINAWNKCINKEKKELLLHQSIKIDVKDYTINLKTNKHQPCKDQSNLINTLHDDDKKDQPITREMSKAIFIDYGEP